MAFGDTARLVAELDLKDNFSKGIGSALNSMGRFQGGLSRMGRGAGQVASGLDRLGTRAALAAAGGLTAVVKTAASFEQAFTGIEKTVDATPAQFAKLESQFREMARSIPVAFEELAGIGEAGGALGIAREDLLDFTDVVARLAVSTNLSSDQAATALGQLGNVLHLSGDDFRDFADSLVALGNAGASTESQIVEIAARFGAAGNAAGLSKEEILALSSAVASMGIEVEAGGSALSRIFNSVATNIGTSSDKAEAFAETLGLSAKEFRRAWERDALGTFQDFLRELGKLDQFEQASILKDIGITNTRDVNTIRLMGQNVSFVAEQLQISQKAQGDLNKESQKFFDTATGQWKTMVNNIRDAGVTIGNEVLPVFKDLVKEFTTFLNQPSTRAGLKAFGQDLADGIRGVVKELKGTDFSGLIDGMKLAASVAKGAFDAFRSLPAPVQQLAIAALVANKVSGGAVGSIAKGLGNIFAGALQTVLPGKIGGTLGGLLGGRGSTPANPLFVSVVGPGALGGAGGAGGAAGGLGFAGGLLLTGGAAATTAGGIMALNDLQRALSEGSKEGIKAGVLDFTGGFPSLIGKFVQDTFFPTGPKVTSPQSSTPLGQFSAANAGGTIPVKDKDAADRLDRLTGGFEGSMRRAIDTSKLTLEQRLIKDPTFKQGLDATEFIRILRRTSEFGAKGTGTSIEQGPKTGRDPFGQAFVALVGRLEKPALRSVEVQGEIRRHIQAAEEVQVAAIKEGDRDAAGKLQQTIDALHRILGTEDRHNALLSEGNRHQTATQAAIRTTAQQTHNFLRTDAAYGRETAANTGVISRKNFSPNLSVGVTVNSSVSISDVQRKITSQQIAIGRGPLEFAG